MTKQEVKNFRNDFQKAIAQLEKQYGVNIGLGTIRFDENSLRTKMTAVKGEKTQMLSKNDFKTKYHNLRVIINSFSEREYEFLFRYLFDNIEEITNDIPTSIILISKYQYEYNFVIDKEINIMALLIELIKLK